MNSNKLQLSDLIIIFLAIIFIIYSLSFPILRLPATSRPLLEKPTNEFDHLLTKIKRDINQENIEINVILGPYFRYTGVVAQLVSSYPKYFILFDIELYNQLTPQEREAVVAHETGHILFKFPRDNNPEAIIEAQVLADGFAARYVNQDHIISMLDKLYAEYRIRVERLEQLKQVKP